MDTNQIIAQIRAIESVEDMERVSDSIRAEPGQMAPEVQAALLDKLKEITAKSKQAREDTIAILRQNGVDYPLDQWLTPKNYALKFGLKSGEVVLNWINRGIVPAENIKEIPELGLRLVKAVEYSPRSYRAAESQKDA